MDTQAKPKALVLVIDDEQIVHQSVQRILQDEGYEVEGALRVDDALAMLEAKSYDLVLTDLMMPDRSGMEAVEAIAANHPDTGVVMFTGFATVESAVQSMKLGALDYLPKPFTPEELIDVAERAIRMAHKSRRDREIQQTYADAEKALTSSLDLKELLNLICTSVERLFKAKGCSVLMLRAEDRALEIAAASGLSETYLSKGVVTSEKSVPEALATGRPVFVDDSQFEDRLQYPREAKKEGIGSILSLPLQVKDAPLGILRVYRSETTPVPDDELELMGRFAEEAAQAIENAVSYQRVRADIEALKRGIPKPIARQMDKQG
ncbi:MAG: response regulator [Thermodesulfobacteriota bacterium]